jgi:alkanesulfonate monooxygenase SsuD/methylene tetrahydromethanopterin reductase-like flavin-dependent oxidoreductase (luciferase family)
LEEARRYPFTAAERQMIAAMPMRSFVGDAEEVHRQVHDLADQSNADEVMITTFLPEPEDRRRMIVEMARVFELPAGWSPVEVAD